MAVLKCKMCGGDMELTADKTFGACEFCGSTMTLPRIDDDQRAAAFNRGNHFRRIGEFDKALAVYERIVREDDTDAEAHWCCALCRFGIEYVEDPASYEWIPTCHRASFDSFLEDVDYLAAVEHSEGIARRQYQKDGAKIAEVQRSILATSQNEDPFDVFICYKESDENGERTKDSLMAQDIYYQLTDQGYRVFFSRITLEDVVGCAYEPYIFAALNSAKVMIVVGTRPEYLNAVWVKNEWSRFLAMMKKDRHKLLLPCYRDMDPYDLPEQLTVLQSYDMGKIGFIQDLSRGIAKVLDTASAAAVKEPLVVQHSGSGNIVALLKRGNMALEDGEWQKADQFFEEVLNQDAECAQAYLGKFLVTNRVATLDEMSKQLTARTENAVVNEKEACPRNTNAENQAIDQFAVPIFLEAVAIRDMLCYDRTYRSTLDSRKKQQDEILQIWNNDKNLSRAMKFGDTGILAQIEQARNATLSVIEARIANVQEKDATIIAEITRNYKQHFEAALDHIRTLHQQAKQEYQVYQEKQQAEEEKRKAEEEKRKAKEAKRKAEEAKANEENQRQIWRFARRCQYCGGNFKGLFTARCSQCGRPQDY